ncbi:arsenate reductase (ArsC) family protein [Malaciobacter marinus]|uniref:Arsenate reductase (ArsC) family protein n=1 Tax=Malaciobacter marinus TaxID=505249 RepID=A0A347TNN1_9BACT|nr:arsenate reductase family protein [Malaciobacter marinus]AXX88209.1 arsenate reductase (ArsC) family protein [Malaciobacter marinus]PHO13913.1 arsenate reductase family protein [Malaciobacter marinus]PHO15742.1 arsenate reductase family protein [Malaciobacter marinus]
MIKVHGIKNCDTVRKALKFFKENLIDYDFFDFKKEEVSSNMIDYWVKNSSIDKLFNNRGATYRNLKLKDLNLDDEGKKKWLKKESMLLKRPVIEYNNKVIVGFNEQEYKDIFL